MEEQELLNYLGQQKENLRNLLDTAIKKQQAIVDNNLGEIENAISAEEKLLNNIISVDKERINILEQLNTKYSLSNNSSRISDFVNSVKSWLSQELVENIAYNQQEIKKTITKINEINTETRFLIEHSRSLLNELMSSLVNSNKKRILDKKV